ncbi:MAG: response regulator transcription factor [Saprospiraceae bacterium]|nr:response regulator transcription factor [Saprospiraceae bacterium]
MTKILIVDDEPDILEFLQYNLEKEGFEVETAIDGEEGLIKAHSKVPDIVVLDIMMPRMDGFEVCKVMRKDPKFDNTIITFLTAKDEDFSQIAALDLGGDDFITKPVSPRVFTSRIKALLRRHRGNESNVQDQIINIADLVIDKEKVLVKRKGEKIELAKKEFELFCLLVEKPGKVYTREEIFRKVWGTDVIVGNRTIDVHIRKLREKVGPIYIKTIKGIGYKFEF